MVPRVRTAISGVLLVLSLALPSQHAAAQDGETAEATPEPPWTVQWKDGFKLTSPDEDFQFRVGGRIQMDGRFTLGDDDPATSTFRIRRLRVSVWGRLFRYYTFVIQPDFAGGSLDLADAWVQVEYWDPARFRIGNMKEPFGYEVLTSDNWVKFAERSMTSNFIGPGYDVGAMAFGSLFSKRFSYGVGLFNGTGTNRTDENDDKDMAVRVSVQPFAPSANTYLKGLSFGGAVTIGNQGAPDIGGSGPSTAMGSKIFTFSPGVMRNQDRTRFGLELQYYAGPFGLNAEFMQKAEHVELAGTGDAPIVITGYYATVAFVVTGEAEGGGPIAPRHPFTPGREGSGPGALEIAARYGQVSADDAITPYITGERSGTQIMVALNWYPAKTVRISPNYQRADYGDSSEDSILFRVQVVY